MITSEELHRTVKLELDQGRASSVEEAGQLARTYRLQIGVGVNVGESVTLQAALLTAVNAGARAFLGGVHVVGALDWTVTVGWFAGRTASDAVEALGGRILEGFEIEAPTVLIGDVGDTAGSVRVAVTWHGWVGGVVPVGDERLADRVENPVAGVAAGAVAVAEAFGHVRGSVVAGRRQTGISLWRPDVNWRDPDAVGPALSFVPTQLWIAGLGHLGQGYLWVLGLLPYSDVTEVCFVLQDFDAVSAANRSTGLLVAADLDVGVLKTRLASTTLERMGIGARLVERRFTEHTRPDADEPTWILTGFDNVKSRRNVNDFQFVVDVGLGSSADDFTGVHVHTFPPGRRPDEVFDVSSRPSPRDAVADVAAWARAAAGDACGIAQLQGVAVGAAFVGAFAAALAVSEVLRVLHGGFVTVAGSAALGALEHIDWVIDGPLDLANPGFQYAGEV